MLVLDKPSLHCGRHSVVCIYTKSWYQESSQSITFAAWSAICPHILCYMPCWFLARTSKDVKHIVKYKVNRCLYGCTLPDVGLQPAGHSFRFLKHLS